MFFFIIWGWQQRVVRLGFVGPYTCPTCSWAGTFWLARVERRLRIYFVPVMRWRVNRYLCTCRNCGSSAQLGRERGDALLDDVRPLDAADPFGPAPFTSPAPARGLDSPDPSVAVDDEAEWNRFVQDAPEG